VELNASTIDRLVLRWSGARADQPAVADAKSTLTHGELGREIRRRAAALRGLGVQSGDRVVLVGDNSALWLATHLAILHAGAVSVPLAGATPADRLGYVVQDSEARLVVAARPATAPVGVVALDDLPAAAKGDTPASVSPDAICCLMYTTGSTGRPKGVVITHRSLGSALVNITTYLGYDGTQREAVVLPLSHSFGLGHAYCTLTTGGFVWLGNGLTRLKQVLDAVTALGLTAMPTTPSMLRLLLGVYRKAFLPVAAQLKQMVVDSEPLPPPMAQDLLAALPDLDLVVYYGLTEASRSTFLRLREVAPERHATVGKAAPNVRVSIADTDGSDLGIGREGEVRIAGAHIARGYWRQAEEQAQVFRNGWVMTGDLGVLDSEGFLRLTGRLKDQINVGGAKVAASEVEAALRDLDGIKDVAVIGIPDPQGQTGEAVAAAVVPSSADLSEKDIQARCTERLEPFMRPRVIRFVKAIPRAETGKVLRAELRDLITLADA
jgi:long-chain acyl-CoA synthetase